MTDTHTTAYIPDEAVQAAAKHSYEYEGDRKGILYVGWEYEGDEVREQWCSSVRQVIAAALPYLSAPCAVEVMELNWVEVSYGFIAHTAFGTYKVKADVDQFMMINSGSEFPTSYHDNHFEAKAAAQADFERRILSNVVTKPVDVAAVRRQAFEEGFENGVEQSLNALDAYDDITRNEAEQSIRKLKPDYRAISAAPTTEAGK